jgi:hypothetical protein
MVAESQDPVQVELRGLRREMAILLERRKQDRELISAIYEELRAFRAELRLMLRRDQRRPTSN